MPNLPIVFSPMSAKFLADRMRFLGNADLLADTYEFNPPEGFNAESWADAAQAMTEALQTGKAIEPTACNVELLVESLEGNRLIGLCAANKRTGLTEVANLIARRLEAYVGRPVRPELT